MKSNPIYGLTEYYLKLKLYLHSWYQRGKKMHSSARVRQQSQQNNVCARQWVCACFPAGAKGLTGCGEILDLSEMSSPPPPAMWNIWLLIMSLFPIVLSLLHVRIHSSPAELIKELEMMLQLSAIAERLSESLVIWSAAGNHPPLTFFGGFWGCFVVFKWVILAYCCLCSPGLLVSGWELS